MEEQLNSLMESEIVYIEQLLEALKEQHHYLIKNEAFALEAIVLKIQKINIDIAGIEIERRKLVNGENMKVLINKLNNDNIESNFRKLKALLELTIIQRDSNELLIKQGIVFIGKMLNVLNPTTKVRTYNSYGGAR